MGFFNFEPLTLPPEAEALRGDVRAFLDEAMADKRPVDRAFNWMGRDREFSRKLGQQGWIGMTWPKKYGGHERTFLERYVLLEELLAAGAPVASHWVADRQSGPMILNIGTEEQREFFLPKIAAGEFSFCIGMSEPDSGSDLAATRAKAVKVDGGWKLSGTKVWTSGAHTADWMIGLFRNDSDPASKHEGLTQYLIDMKSDGLNIRPIINLAGQHHFNECVFDEVFVPDDRVIGTVGNGWKQVTSELAFERSGPERYLSCIQLVIEMLRLAKDADDPALNEELGRLTAHVMTLRRMSLAVAGKLQRGENPALEASVVKDVGGVFEQALPEIAQRLLGDEPTLKDGTDFQEVLAFLMQEAPSFSLRGGTREILRGIIARGLGLR
ncbi:acyl-CoA dehydrogenase family protein [Minwuia sp.]|uniref:acyl-CoA dehydrogenase family protein n=1 Tax=Minwuia sp. TaxID=2493630 RepID=UPI003A94C881